METVDEIRNLFRYNAWANRRVVSALVENKDERARQILAHLLTTEQEYFERLWGRDSTGFDFWPDLGIEACGSLAASVAERYEKLTAGLNEDSLDTIATYKTSEGVAHENTWRELLTHVLLHSATHRGNIIIELRGLGVTPPATDYIIYQREKQKI